MKGVVQFGALAVIAVIVLAAAAISGNLPVAEIKATPSTCQDIYAYYPSFRCCDDTQSQTGTKTLVQDVTDGSRQKWQCPANANSCDVTVSQSVTVGDVYYGTQNCAGGFLNIFGCSDGVRVVSENTLTVQPGTWFYTPNGLSKLITFRVYGLKLCECSISPCGEPCPKVTGSDGCGFNTDSGVYDSTGRIKESANPLAAYAYTVPFGDCFTWYPANNRHAIGNTCESCSATADCASQYPLKYTYNGVQYGAVCDGSNVQLYDCMMTGAQVCLTWRQDRVGSNVECLEYSKTSRCDLFRAIPVQCCPGSSSCGAGSFCDPLTYTCKATAQCSADSDCGTNVMCDYTTKKLKTPDCVSGQCAFSEQPVACCNDGNCATGYYCDAAYTCKEKTSAKVPCPYGCCAGSEQFFDRPCASGTVCCSANSPSASCQASCTVVPSGDCNTAASCAVGDVGCFIQSSLADIWCSILAAIISFMAGLGAAVGGFVVGLIVAGVLMALLYWYIPQARAIMVGMPYVTIIAVIVIALVVAAVLF